tara:strand:- start:197 stop:355 length:159 start_codon:yes stop_codon:yes gene_type:complete
MRKPSKLEIKSKMLELNKNDKKPTRTEKVFYTIFLVIILSWIIGGISNLFSK